MTLVLGVDGCRAGWCGVSIEVDGNRQRLGEPRLYGSFSAVLTSDAKVICVDIPIGLREDQCKRKCDEKARELLKSRWPCVFWAPSRQVLEAEELAPFMSGMPVTKDERHRLFELAGDINQAVTTLRLSQQAFAICPKIHQVDSIIHGKPALQDRVYEVHPEICFTALNGGEPIRPNKATSDGQRERWQLLWKALWPSLADEPEPLPWPKNTCQPDDYVDALVAAWTAVCILRKHASRVPMDQPEIDDRGLRMEMWLPAPKHRVRTGPAAHRR